MIKNISIKNLFLAISIFFGLLYVFILPPFQSVDEGMHFYRTYQISQGRLIAKNLDGKIGDELPESLSNFYNLYTPFIKNIDMKTGKKDIIRNFNLKLNEKNKVYTEFTNTALYSPVCYISQLPGVIISKALNFPLAGIYYAGRICNLIFYCIFVYLALGIIPFFRLPLLLLAIMPMSLSLAGAYTCDVAVLGFNFIWISMILRFITDSSEKQFKIYLPAFMLLAFLISLTKSYILLLPLIFLIAPSKFKNIKYYAGFMLGVIFAALSGCLLWYFMSKGLTLNMNDTVANSALQAQFIKSHPFLYIGILLKTFIVKTPRLIITMIGVLGWQDTKLDWITYIIYPFLIYFAVYSDKFQFTLCKWQKYLIILTTLVGVVLTYTSLYLMWSPVGNSVVLGLNGKYFIPLVLPCLLLFKNGEGKYDYNTTKIAIIAIIILILISSELSLLHRFYNITPQLYYKI